jgi:hypothetical protein
MQSFKMDRHNRTICFRSGESLFLKDVTGMLVDNDLGLIAYTTKKGPSYHVYREHVQYAIIHDDNI